MIIILVRPTKPTTGVSYERLSTKKCYFFSYFGWKRLQGYQFKFYRLSFLNPKVLACKSGLPLWKLKFHLFSFSTGKMNSRAPVGNPFQKWVKIMGFSGFCFRRHCLNWSHEYMKIIYENWGVKNSVKEDHRRYRRNFSSCVRDSNPWPLRYRCSAPPVELTRQSSSHRHPFTGLILTNSTTYS